MKNPILDRRRETTDEPLETSGLRAASAVPHTFGIREWLLAGSLQLSRIHPSTPAAVMRWMTLKE